MQFEWRPVLGVLLFILLLTFVILMSLGIIPLTFSTNYTTNVYETEPTTHWYSYLTPRAKDMSGNAITFY